MKSKYMKTTKEILNQMFTERNSSTKTKETYKRSINYLEKTISKTLPEMLNTAETEEENNISWKNSSLRKWLITYRKWCYTTYKKTTAETYFIAAITTFRHFEITVNKLPYFSTKKVAKPTPINPDLLVDRDVLRLCIGVNNPILKALILLMSSSGISRTDVLNLTLKDYLESTYEYHECDDLNQAIETMMDKDVIPTWNITRQKTGVSYYTFSSPESTKAINNYLLTRHDDDPRLFKINKRYMSRIFKDTNDELGLGNNGEFSRFAPHMLRRFHATQLIESGMSESKVDLLQGRKPSSIAYQSYVKIKPSKLRDEYIGALPFLVIEDINRVKTELDATKEQLEEVTVENNKYRNDLKDILERIRKLEENQ